MAERSILASDVRPEAIRWLLDGFIPLGALTLLNGDPGSFKSTLIADLAARVSKGKRMPFGSSSTPENAASVLLFQGEDVVSRVRAMLEAAEADLSKISIACSGRNGPALTLPDDISHLEDLAMRQKAKLIVLDPLSECIKGGINNESSVRAALRPLADLAGKLQAAIILIRHLSKNQSRDARRAGIGTIASTAAARSELLLAPDPAYGECRALAVSKTNLAAKPAQALLFRPIADGDCARVYWLGKVTMTADELLAGNEVDTVLSEAKKFLKDQLAAGERLVTAMELEARAEGISSRTLTRARKQLRVITRREGFAPAVYYVSLPPDPYGEAIARRRRRAEAIAALPEFCAKFLNTSQRGRRIDYLSEERAT